MKNLRLLLSFFALLIAIAGVFVTNRVQANNNSKLLVPYIVSDYNKPGCIEEGFCSGTSGICQTPDGVLYKKVIYSGGPHCPAIYATGTFSPL
jgi:hypothetical protein